MNNQNRRSISCSLPSLYSGASVASPWRWAGLLLTVRGIMAG